MKLNNSNAIIVLRNSGYERQCRVGRPAQDGPEGTKGLESRVREM
jgi:hypothetical protein